MTKKIMEVVSVSATMLEREPPILKVKAKGQVNSGGWSNGELSPFIYINPPADGVQDFDFLADEPDGQVIAVNLPIEASYEATCADWVKGVRVHATTNKIEKPV